MAWARVQFKTAGADAAAVSVPATFTDSNPVAGNTLIAFITNYDADGPFTVSSVTDTIGNTWLPIGSKTIVSSLGGNWAANMYYCVNTTTAANTVTANFSGSAQYRGIEIFEYSGLDSSPFDKTSSKPQVDPGTVANAVTSDTTAATTVDNELVLGCTLGVNGFQTSAGTGFSSINLNTNVNLFTYLNAEQKNLTPTGTTAATFTTASATDDFITFVATFKEPSTVTQATPSNTRRTIHW